MPHFNIFIPHLQILRTIRKKNVLCTKNLFLVQTIGVQLVPADFNGIKILLSLCLEIDISSCSSSIMHHFEELKLLTAAAIDDLPR